MNKVTKWVLGILFNPIFTMYAPIFLLENTPTSAYMFPVWVLVCSLWWVLVIVWAALIIGEFDE